MSPGPAIRAACTRLRRRQDGIALAISLLLLLILTMLGTTGLVTAVLELRMAANAQYHARAFEAAEFAIEQAMHSPALATSITYANPSVVPVSGTAPSVPGSTPDTYSYRLYYDTSTAPDPAVGTFTGLKAYHFVVEATGTSARGAVDTHVQGFYVLGPDPAPTSLVPPACAPPCVSPIGYGPTRTYWLQKSAE